MAITSAPHASAVVRRLSTSLVEVSQSEKRVGAAAAGRFERIFDVFGAGRGKKIIHEVRFRRGLQARPCRFLWEDVARTRVHAAIVIGDLEAVERVLHARLQALFADRLLDPVECVDGLDFAALIGLVPGLLRQTTIDLARACVGGEVVFGLFQIVIEQPLHAP